MLRQARLSENHPKSDRLLGETPGLFYIHGALHLYLAGGELGKHSWVRTGERLTELIRAGLDQKQYPLFVAEGTPDRKRDQIQRHGYLWYCLDKFARIESPLVVYGHSLGASDQHLVDTIAENPKLRTVFIGLHGCIESPVNRATVTSGSQMVDARTRLGARRRKVKPLEVRYFQSESADVWG